MRDLKNAGDRFFLAYIQAATFEQLERTVKADPVLAAKLIPSPEYNQLRNIKGLNNAQFIAYLERVDAADAPGLMGVALCSYVIPKGPSMTMHELLALERVVVALDKADSLDLQLLKAREAHILVRKGRVRDATLTLDGVLGALSAPERSPRGDYVRHIAYMGKADISTQTGDYHAANSAMETAASLATAWDFCNPQLLYKVRMAELMWLSGQPEQALLLHTDSSVRKIARDAENTVWLVRSHTSAAKCAVDCKKPDVAECELAEASNLLDAQPETNSPQHGYITLFQGEILLQRDDVDGAIKKYNEAQRQFEALDPPYHRGILAAKIQLAEFALYDKNYDLFMKLVDKLMAEAEEQGCIEERSRLLLLQAYVFITDDPPLKAAFERAVERVHLINNPALLFKALSFLYHYALRFLGERDQVFLLARLRRLEGLLEDSCYESLYRTHVSELYQDAIEHRLASLFEAEEGALEDED